MEKDPLHLFVIYIGGAHSQSFVELHDMRFVAARHIEETYDALRKSWWGIPASLHLDAWGILHYADGHRIHISDKLQPPRTDNRLYFVNLGGYDHHQFTELHKNIFVVAPDEQQAKLKAVAQIKAWESPHRDYLHTVDTVLDMNALLSNNQHYLHLNEENEPQDFEFTCCYTPIGK